MHLSHGRGRRSVIRIWRPASPPVGRCRSQPVGATGSGFDHREASRRDGTARFGEPRLQLASSGRKALPKELSVAPHAGVILCRAQDQQRRADSLRSPTDSTSRVPRFALVPGQCSLNATKVVDFRLDLAAQEASIRCPIREDIDPTPIAAGADLDLLADVPAKSAEPSGDVAAAFRVDEVALLATALEAERGSIEPYPNAEELERGRCELDVEMASGGTFEA